MLIAHGLLPDLVSQLSSYSLFGIAPIWWDQTEGQFKVKKSAITCIGSVITFQLGLVLIVHDFYQQYQLAAVANPVESSSGSIPAIEKGYSRTQRISCALLLFMVAIVHDRNMRSAHAIVTLFNGMIAFEQKHTGRLRLPTDWKGKTTKYFCLLVRFFNNIGPLLISILVVVAEPSSPLNVVPFLQTSQTLTTSSSSSTYSSSSSGELGDANGGSDLSSSSSGITIITSNQMVQKFITGTITALLNMMVWYMVVNIRGFWTCGQVLIGCYGIRSALNLYSSIMTRGKLLRITKEKVQEAFIYREIQLLANLFNEVHGNSIFVILLLLSSLLQTISLYLYVRFVTTMTSSNFFVLSGWTWTSRLFVAYMVFDSIFVVFVVFGCCSEVYITSVQVKAHLQYNDVFQRSEWFTQFFLSCSTIKLKCGSTNFISERKFGNACRSSSTTSLSISSEMVMANGNSTCSVALGSKMGMVVNNGNNSSCSVASGNASSVSVSGLTVQSGGFFDIA